MRYPEFYATCKETLLVPEMEYLLGDLFLIRVAIQ